MHGCVNAERFQTVEIQVLNIVGRRFQDYLKLIIVLEAKRVLAVAAVSGPAARLHVSRPPRFRPERAQKRSRMKGARPHGRIIGLHNRAALTRPVMLERQYQILEIHVFCGHLDCLPVLCGGKYSALFQRQAVGAF